jgi:hypothetical protein
MIDPRISLAAQAPDISNTLQMFNNSLNSAQNRRSNQQFNQQQAALLPGQLQAQQQNIDINQSAINTQAENETLISIGAIIPQLRGFISTGDNLGALSFLNSRNQDLIAQGRTEEERRETLDAIEIVTNENLDQLGQELDVVEQLLSSRGLGSRQATSVGQREFDSLVTQAEGDINDVSTQAARVKLRLDAPAGESAAERIASDQSVTDSVALSGGQIAGARTTATGIAARNQGYINTGIDAADSVANLTKTLNLLKTVETGGFNNVALAASRILGVTGADEAELSANMGKAILAQLKPIFGAAFTAQEGERLEKIEASFGKSTQANVRLIQNVLRTTERAARRGLEAAKTEGDTFTANEIQTILDGVGSEPIDTQFTESEQRPKFVIESID